MLPTISNYGEYSSDNYGAHSLVVGMEKIRVFFSYQTAVAFEASETGLICSENVWGKTTGKHLNWIEPDHKARVPYNEFCKKLEALLK